MADQVIVQETLAQRFKRLHGDNTDLRNELSYGNGVKNIVGLLKKKGTGLSIRMSIKNTSDEQRTVYFMPILTIKGGTSDRDKAVATILAAGLPAGYVFFQDIVETIEDEPVKTLEFKSLNRDQNLTSIATELTFSPMQIIALDQISYNAKTGAPESGNNGNTVTHYGVSSLRPMRYKDLSLSQFQSAKNLSNNIVKVDFIKENFVCPISTNDFFAIQVNANTKLDLTLAIGARDSRPEYFYRQITAGQDLLTENFPSEIGENCGCN